ncbi:hypothetical protein FSP39_006881, partial [Pinctada imbricata]
IFRVLTCYQPVRYRKRRSKAPGWFVPRRGGGASRDLTKENRDFLRDLVKEKYDKTLSSPLKEEPWPRGTWDFGTKRVGLLAIKLGMTAQFNKKGQKVACTLLQVVDNHVVGYTPPEKFMNSVGWKPWWRNMYGSVTVGAMSCDPSGFTKAYNNIFLNAGVPTKRKLTRFLVTPNAAVQPGTRLNVMHFKVGDYIDLQAKTVDHGFQGVVKRWGFKGQRQSHGVGKSERRPGATGVGRVSSGIIKGKKLPGHMGSDWNTSKGSQIVRINTKYNLIYVRGPCSGPTHCFVRIMDTCLPVRRDEIEKSENHPSMPTTFPEDLTEEVPEEYFHESLHQFNEPSITYSADEDSK